LPTDVVLANEFSPDAESKIAQIASISGDWMGLDIGPDSIKVFFNKNDLNLIGWETIDVYQNVVQTFISDIQKNITVNKKIFNIQRYIN